MQRITDKQLNSLAEWLNKITGAPNEPYSKDENGKLRANIGNYHISHAYGGVCLHQMVNESGGVKCPISQGHGTKRELYNQMHAYIRALEDVRYNHVNIERV